MPTVNMLDAKTRLSQLVQAVENGEETEIIIARNGKPAARLVAVAEPARQPFRFGTARDDPGMKALVEMIDDPEMEKEVAFAWEEFWNEDIATGQDILPRDELRERFDAKWKP